MINVEPGPLIIDIIDVVMMVHCDERIELLSNGLFSLLSGNGVIGNDIDPKHVCSFGFDSDGDCCVFKLYRFHR